MFGHGLLDSKVFSPTHSYMGTLAFTASFVTFIKLLSAMCTQENLICMQEIIEINMQTKMYFKGASSKVFLFVSYFPVVTVLMNFSGNL